MAAAALALVLMLLAQRYVARMSRRILNVLSATVGHVLVGLGRDAPGQRAELAGHRRAGPLSVELLSAANVLLSRAQGDTAWHWSPV